MSFRPGPLRKSDKRLKAGQIIAELTREDHRTKLDDIRARLQIHDYNVDGLSEVLDELVDEGVLAEETKSYRFKFPIVAQYLVREGTNQ